MSKDKEAKGGYGMNNFAPGTEDYSLPDKFVYFLVSHFIKLVDMIRARQV